MQPLYLACSSSKNCNLGPRRASRPRRSVAARAQDPDRPAGRGERAFPGGRLPRRFRLARQRCRAAPLELPGRTGDAGGHPRGHPSRGRPRHRRGHHPRRVPGRAGGHAPVPGVVGAPAPARPRDGRDARGAARLYTLAVAGSGGSRGVARERSTLGDLVRAVADVSVIRHAHQHLVSRAAAPIDHGRMRRAVRGGPRWSAEVRAPERAVRSGERGEARFGQRPSPRDRNRAPAGGRSIALWLPQPARPMRAASSVAVRPALLVANSPSSLRERTPTTVPQTPGAARQTPAAVHRHFRRGGRLPGGGRLSLHIRRDRTHQGRPAAAELCDNLVGGNRFGAFQLHAPGGHLSQGAGVPSVRRKPSFGSGGASSAAL